MGAGRKYIRRSPDPQFSNEGRGRWSAWTTSQITALTSIPLQFQLGGQTYPSRRHEKKSRSAQRVWQNRRDHHDEFNESHEKTAQIRSQNKRKAQTFGSRIKTYTSKSSKTTESERGQPIAEFTTRSCQFATTSSTARCVSIS